jgi:hypothetical protein
MQALRQAIGGLQAFTGHAAVFVSMADIWYDKLYKHSVTGSTMGDVQAFSKLDELMADIVSKTTEGIMSQTVEAVARAAFEALKTTLLSGGEHRYFEVSDTDQLQSDLNAMKVCLKLTRRSVCRCGVCNDRALVFDRIKALFLACGVGFVCPRQVTDSSRT